MAFWLIVYFNYIPSRNLIFFWIRFNVHIHLLRMVLCVRTTWMSICGILIRPIQLVLTVLLDNLIYVPPSVRVSEFVCVFSLALENHWERERGRLSAILSWSSPKRLRLTFHCLLLHPPVPVPVPHPRPPKEDPRTSLSSPNTSPFTSPPFPHVSPRKEQSAQIPFACSLPAQPSSLSSTQLFFIRCDIIAWRVGTVPMSRSLLYFSSWAHC